MTKRDVDWILIEALATGSTQREAAKAAGVCERTVRRRLEDPEFKAALAQRRRELRDMVEARLAVGAEFAVRTLLDVMDTGPPGARVRASTAVLDRVPLVTEPPAPPEPVDHGAVDRIRQKLDEMAERMHATLPTDPTPVDIYAEDRPEADKTGQNGSRSTFPDPPDPFPGPT